LVVSPVSAQTPAKISGVVKDNKNVTLPGVSVKVKGTQIGALTDIDGKYSINAPAGATLVFSYVSYTTKEVVVGANHTIDVILLDNSTDLNEVVVTGYGQGVAKRDLVGSIGTVSAKQIQERQPLSLLDALQGNIAGAQVVLDGGDPFSQGTIQIRGASTINGGNGPLYVIDGILQNDATFLNPSDIASIEVLKDAASAAIYGVRGANGVIIVTTKRGKEGKPVLNLNYYHLFGQLAHKLQTVSANDLRYYRKLRGDGLGGVNTDSVNHYLNADNDFQDLLFRTANKDNINLSISGGQKGLTYYGSANYTNDKSIVLNSQAQTLKTVLNVDYAPNDRFKITNNVNYSYQNGNVIPVGTSAKQVFERNPWTSIYKPDGTLAGYVESKRNPVAFAMYSTNEPTIFIFQDNIQASYKIFNDLRFTGSFNGRLDNIQTQTFTPSALTATGIGLNVGSSELEKKFSYELQAYFNYNKTFNKVHTLTVNAGFTRDRYRDDDFTFGLTNYLSESVFTSNTATLVPTATGTSATYNSTESMFARAQYSFKERYIVSGTFRRDGSSRFGPENKWGNFGSVGAAWRFSDEPFMKGLKKFIDDAKLRYSYGVLGNDKVGDFGYATLYDFGAGTQVTNSGVYNGNTAAYVSTSLGNPTIHWESTTSHNFGLDLTMFNGRLTITPEYYIKKYHRLDLF
jgi:TonB-linked SusC/RagA family outer membrane protein